MGLMILFIFGAAMGSFLNVVVYRLPREQSLLRPPSFCPACKLPLAPADNVPIFAWFYLRGRARCCGAKISGRYPAIELLTAILWVTLGALFVNTPYSRYVNAGILTAQLALVTLLIAITLIDFDYHYIPDEFTLGGFIVAVAVSGILPRDLQLVVPAPRFTAAIHPCLFVASSGIITALLTYLFAKTGDFFVRRRLREIQKDHPEVDSVLGLGDVKLMGFFGALFGLMPAVMIFVLATIYGALYGIAAKFYTGEILIATANGAAPSVWQRLQHRWQTGSSVIPFGPYLCAGALTWLLWMTTR